MFITTTLPYVNGVPHIGHCFEFVLADAITRAHKNLLKKDVFFNVGLDEHGLKVWQAAQAKGVTVEEHIAEMTTTWVDFCERFEIGYDNFYKTSSPEHHAKVQQVWTRLLNSGDIYKKEYTGQYCVGCEAFKLTKDLTEDGTCPDHPTTPIQQISEENYFFRLSDYKQDLSAWISENSDFLLPSNKHDELANIISNAEDISISRKKEACPWGVPVPDDTEQVIYVWFDALLNYIFAAGDNRWEEVVQLCGPDNLRFQGVIFQAFLFALGINQTDKLLVHGTIVDANGVKFSKSLGNATDPLSELDKYGIDAVRYYLLAGLNAYQTSSWNPVDLVHTFNAEVVNDWGNMIARVLHMVDLHGVGKRTEDFVGIVATHKQTVHEAWKSFQVKDALKATNELVKFGNKYITDTKPWLVENESARANAYYLLRVAVDLYQPIFPSKYEEMVAAIDSRKKAVLFTKLA